MKPDKRKTLIEQVRRMSDGELVDFRANKIDTSVDAIVADREFEHRARVHQHDLDLDLLFKQGRWMKFSAMATAAATLIGTIVGALLTFWLQSNPQPKQPESPRRPAQEQTGQTSSVDRIEKAVPVPFDPP